MISNKDNNKPGKTRGLTRRTLPNKISLTPITNKMEIVFKDTKLVYYFYFYANYLKIRSLFQLYSFGLF